MNDYLHNLAARTLRISPVVRPRLPSLFESLREVAQPPALALPEAIYESRPSPSPVAEVFRKSSSESPSAQPPVPATFESRSATTNAEAALVAQANTNIAKPNATPTAEISTPTELSIRNSITRAVQPTGHKPGAELLPTESRPHESLSSSKVETQPTPVYHLTTESPAPARRELVEPLAIRSLPSPRIDPRVAPSNGAVLVPGMQEMTAFVTPEVGPTINVTIGRVDVRAVFPQPQPQPQRTRRSHPAPMSLDDYLKGRSGGRK